MRTISGDHEKTVTLTAGAPRVTVTGVIDAEGRAGSYNGAAAFGALFGAAGTHFDILNVGLIESGRTAGQDGGIVLGSAGTVTNGGTASGAYGILMFGGAGGLVVNSRLLEGDSAYGVYLHGKGIVENTGSGLITGKAYGVVLARGGSVETAGYIQAATGVAVEGKAGTVVNSGHIQAGGYYGVYLGAGGTVNNTGSITAALQGVLSEALTDVVNGGYIRAGDGVLLAGAGGDVDNTGVILATVGDGISLRSAGGVDNAGGVTAAVWAAALGGGTVYNSGSVSGAGGFYLDGGGTVVNRGLVLSEVTYGAQGAVLITGEAGEVENMAGGMIRGGEWGVRLSAGGSVNNAGTIFDGQYGVSIYGARGTVVNEAGGTIMGTHEYGEFNPASGAGIVLMAGGYVDNEGYLGGSFGIFARNAPVTVVSGGTIRSDIDLFGGGTLKNTGFISAYQAADIQDSGVLNNSGYMLGNIELSGGSLLNTGTLVENFPGQEFAGVNVSDGYVSNRRLIQANFGSDLSVMAGGTVFNAGVIAAIVTPPGYRSGVAVYIDGGGTLINVGSLLTTFTASVEVKGGGTVMNAGLISDGISFQSSYANRLVLEDGSVIGGGVAGGGGVLELAAGAGTVGNASFSGFETIDVDARADWVLGAGFSPTGAVLWNDGTLAQQEGGSLALASVSGTGRFDLNGTLTLEMAVSSGQSFEFGGAGDTLALTDPDQFNGTIGNFGAAETIFVGGILKGDLTEFAFGDGVLTLAGLGEVVHLTFVSPDSFAAPGLVDFADGSGVGITVASAAAPAVTAAGWMDGFLQQRAAALVPVVTLQG